MMQGGCQQDDLLVLGVRMILWLAQQAHQALTIHQLALGCLIQIAGKLGKYLHLPILGQIQPQSACGLFHGFGLGITAHTGHGQSHIDSGTLS